MRKTKLLGLLALFCIMLASCAFRSSENAFGPYSAAENYYKKADYSKAIMKYQEYLSGNPQGNLAAIAQYFIGKSYVASGDEAKARENFEAVVTKFPKTSWAAFAKEQLVGLTNTAKA